MEPDPREGRSREFAWLAAVTCLSAALRFFDLGGAPLTGEEKWSLVQATGYSFIDVPVEGAVVDAASLSHWANIRDVLHRIGAFDQPVFILLTHYAVRWLGPSEGTVRLLPALMGVLAPALVFTWARRFVDRNTALLAAVLVSVHPFHLSLSRLGRVYTLAGACLLVGYMVPTRWRSRRVSSPTAVFLGLQPLTHMLSGFGLIPHLVCLRFVERLRRRQILASVAAGLLLLAGALPFGLADSIVSEHVYTGLVHRGASGPFSLSPASLASTLSFHAATLLGLDVEGVGLRTRYFLPVLLPLLALCFRGLARLRGAARVIFLVGATLPTFVGLILSFTYQHLLALIPRYSVWALPFLMILLALGLRSLPRGRTFAAGLVMLYLALDVVSLTRSRPGYPIADALALGECSTRETPINVHDALDGFVAGTTRERGAFFKVGTAYGAEERLNLSPTMACYRHGLVCPGVAPCPEP